MSVDTTSSRIIQYIAGRVATIEGMQAALTTYATFTHTTPAAVLLINQAITELQTAQNTLAAAVAAQASG